MTRLITIGEDVWPNACRSSRTPDTARKAIENELDLYWPNTPNWLAKEVIRLTMAACKETNLEDAVLDPADLAAWEAYQV